MAGLRISRSIYIAVSWDCRKRRKLCKDIRIRRIARSDRLTAWVAAKSLLDVRQVGKGVMLFGGGDGLQETPVAACR